MPTLTLGKHNPRLSDIRRAVHDGSLTPDGLLPVEGTRLIEEAIRSGLEIPEAYCRRGDTVPALPPGCSVYELEESGFRKIQSTETSQGVVALVHIPRFQLSAITESGKGPIVVLAELQDPGNVGTILRAAESFDAAGCVALAGTASPYNPKSVRASAGSVFRLPHVWNVDADETIDAFRKRGFRVVATGPAATASITTWNWQEPTAVLIGNEGSGVRPETLRRCDAALRIPHNPQVESLNSAVAAALVLYEAYRQRGGAE
ncbi:MAG TPA: RNA methyltransferase [Terriglobia bacterium]|nr:RNA methyltransferase [Terriglobia bacterium]